MSVRVFALNMYIRTYHRICVVFGRSSSYLINGSKVMANSMFRILLNLCLNCLYHVLRGPRMLWKASGARMNRNPEAKCPFWYQT